MTHDEVSEQRFHGKGVGLLSGCSDPSLFPLSNLDRNAENSKTWKLIIFPI